MPKISAIIFDFSGILLFALDPAYFKNLNGLNRELIEKYGTYNAWDYFALNDEALKYIKTLKLKYPVYVFTSDAVQNQPQVREKLDGIFTGIYSAKEQGLNKKEPEAYSFMADKLEISPGQLLYIDDRQSNLDAAATAGMQTLLYTDNKNLFREILTFI